MKTGLQGVFLFVVVSVATAQPYLPRVIWDRSGQTDSSAYGYKILPLGDQNNDGFADWAVLAHGNIATYHGTHRPYLEFFHGGLTPADSLPYFVFQQDSPAYYQSWSAGVVGDINGDGYEDWMTEYWPQGFPPYLIEAIFYGGHASSSTPDFTWTVPLGSGFYWFDNFDFNGDGIGDLFGGWGNSVRIYYGGAPLDTLADWVLHEPPPGINQSYPYAVGDFNGDWASDFILFNPNNGNLAIFLGGANPDTVPAYFWSNQFSPDAGIDSLNDGIYDDWTSGACIHFGRPELTPGCDVILNSIAGSFGEDGGDFNNDGYHDLILYTWSTLDNPFGALDLHLGHPWLNPDPVFTIEGNEPPFNLRGIYTATGLGDVNGDNLDDFAIGVWNETFGPWRGRCVIIGGDSLPVAANPARPELPHDIMIEAYPNPFNAETTVKLTLPWSQKLNELTVYNSLGQTVRHEVLPPFVSQVTYGFNGRDLPSGTYFLAVRSGSLSKSQKLMLLR